MVGHALVFESPSPCEHDITQHTDVSRQKTRGQLML